MSWFQTILNIWHTEKGGGIGDFATAGIVPQALQKTTS